MQESRPLGKILEWNKRHPWADSGPFYTDRHQSFLLRIAIKTAQSCLHFQVIFSRSGRRLHQQVSAIAWSNVERSILRLPFVTGSSGVTGIVIGGSELHAILGRLVPVDAWLGRLVAARCRAALRHEVLKQRGIAICP